MRINPTKRIGKVLYMVEGDVDEAKLLEHVFHKVLNYSVVSYDKRGDSVSCLINPNDKYSRVFIVPMRYSAISKIESSNDYVNYIYSKLKSFGLEKDECAKYLIFDRDNGSNSYDTIKKLFKTFKNSLDNDLDINGLLLISYPCVQSFLCECFKDETRLSSSFLMKKYSSMYKIGDINNDNLLNGINAMIRTILNITLQANFDINELDNMEVLNTKILDHQENCYCHDKTYITLSMLFISFLDLGIIEL